MGHGVSRKGSARAHILTFWGATYAGVFFSGARSFLVYQANVGYSHAPAFSIKTREAFSVF